MKHSETKRREKMSEGVRGAYTSWRKARERCNNPKQRNYEAYGGRGIVMHPKWDSFKEFLRDMGPRPKGKTLDRRMVNGPYAPGNCKWSTLEEQAANKREKPQPR